MYFAIVRSHVGLILYLGTLGYLLSFEEPLVMLLWNVGAIPSYGLSCNLDPQ